MERIIELRIELGYSITTYHALRMNAMRSMQILKSIMIMLNETWINRRVKAKEFIENTIPMIKVIKHA
jgi:hypothetical protein